MWPAAALLPATLPRPAIVTAPPSSGAGEAPTGWDRCMRIEGSSISAATASATLGSSVLEVSPTVRAVVLGMLLAHSSRGPHPRSDPKASTKTKEGSSIAMMLRLTAVFRSRSYCGDSRVPKELRFRRPRRSPGRDHTPKVARPDTTPSAPPAYPSARRCNRPGINAQMPGIFTCYAQ